MCIALNLATWRHRQTVNHWIPVFWALQLKELRHELNRVLVIMTRSGTECTRAVTRQDRRMTRDEVTIL